MKKIIFLGFVLLLGAFIVSGCGNFGKNADKSNREEAVIIPEKDKVGGSMQTGNGYGFDKFDLDIEIDGKDAVDAEYDVSKSKIEAEFENKLENVKLKNDDAFNELDKLFVDIMITKDTPKQEVIDKILKYYGIDTYSKFDLEVEFDDGILLDIEEGQ
ncbi:YusW family protein [Sporosarcina sp. FA9]|uniref:YusW family protein n=1 Tax=Sporosarcina sp. FA9 TaxID=3413030 RepID=UPI003F65DE68